MENSLQYGLGASYYLAVSWSLWTQAGWKQNATREWKTPPEYSAVRALY